MRLPSFGSYNQTATDELGHVLACTYDNNGQVQTKKTIRTKRRLLASNLLRQLGVPLLASADTVKDANAKRVHGPIHGPLVPRLVHAIRQDDFTVEELLTKYYFDKEGRLDKVTFPDSSFTQIFYNLTGTIDHITDVLGRNTYYTYDIAGRHTQTTFPDGTRASSVYDNLGRKIFGIDPANRKVGFTYDTLDRLVQTSVYPENSNTPAFSASFTYNDAGQVVSETDANGHTTASTLYDFYGMARRVSDATGRYIDYDYDVQGRSYKVTDAAGHVSVQNFDRAGDITSATVSDGQPGGQSRTVTYEYDNRGLLHRIVSPSGRATTYAYDDKRRLSSVTNPNSETTTYGYDELDNLLTVTDANGHTKTNDYDIVGHLIRHTLPGGPYQSFTYNADNSIASYTDYNGYTTTYSYLPNSRFLSQVTPDLRKGELPIAYTYFADGRLKTATRGSLVTTYGYDTLGRLTSVASPTGTVSYGYDNGGNRTRLTSPAGTTTYTYDEADRLVSVTPPGSVGAFTYDYDVLGRLQMLTRPNGVTTAYQYDTLSQLTGVVNSSGPSFGYSYDLDGRRQTMTDDAGTTTYGYDLAGRLMNENGPRKNVGYAYDPVGNRLSTTENGQTSFYHYDVNDRLRSIQTPTGPVVYGFDNNGNVTNANGLTLGYDFQNRMVSAGGSSFVYDAEGNRIQQTGSGGTTAYLLDGEDVIAEYQSGQLSARYDYGLGLLSGWRSADGAFSYLHDGQGSTVGLTNAGGALSSRYVYDAFGNPQQLQGNSSNPFLGVGGEQYDSDTGLYFLRARYYDPKAGRFLSADPLSGNEENDYAYAMGDPVNGTDPSGLSTLTEQMQVSNLAPQIRGIAQKLGGIAQNVAEDAIEDFLSGNDVNWESLGTSAFGHTLDAIHPLLGTAVQIGQGLVQTYQGVQQALSVLLDPNASAEQIQQAALTGLFQVSNFAFSRVVSRFNPGQYVQLLGQQAFKGRLFGVLEHLVPWGLDRMAAAVTTRTQSMLADGKHLIDEDIQLGLCGEEKCFPAGTQVVGRWSDKQPDEDPATATHKVAIDQLVLSERVAQEDAEDTARNMTGRQVGESVVWSLRGAHWWVVSRDEATGKLLWQRVRTTSVNETDELVAISLSNGSGQVVERIEATAEHPFFTTRGQVKAGNLGIGTEIITRAGPPLTISKVEMKTRPEGYTVYNFEVEDVAGQDKPGQSQHSYFVGTANGGVWVHNGCTDNDPYNFITYIFENAGEIVYVGRASGNGSPEQVLKDRIRRGSKNRKTGQPKNPGPDGKARHDHYYPELGDKPRVLEVHDNEDASKGAEYVWWQRFRGEGKALRNVDAPRDLTDNRRIPGAVRAFRAYMIQIIRRRR